MSAIVDIRAPAEQTEGTRSQVLRWLKQVGERVTQNEPLIELETDKVTVEVASPAAGVLREILKQEQEEIAPGELLGRLESARRPPPPRAAASVAPAAHAGRCAEPRCGGAARRAASAPLTRRTRCRRARLRRSARRCGACSPSMARGGRRFRQRRRRAHHGRGRAARRGRRRRCRERSRPRHGGCAGRQR